MRNSWNIIWRASRWSENYSNAAKHVPNEAGRQLMENEMWAVAFVAFVAASIWWHWRDFLTQRANCDICITDPDFDAPACLFPRVLWLFCTSESFPKHRCVASLRTLFFFCLFIFFACNCNLSIYNALNSAENLSNICDKVVIISFSLLTRAARQHKQESFGQLPLGNHYRCPTDWKHRQSANNLI